MRLPYDSCRCKGQAQSVNPVLEGYTCPIRSNCARYQALNDMGPRTPIIEFYCQSGTLTGFIQGEPA